MSRVASTPTFISHVANTPVGGRTPAASLAASPVTPRKSPKQITAPSRPGMIDNACLIQSPAYRTITVLTGEGGKLKSASKLVRGKDYELVPERLWKFLSNMYGGSPSLPRQVIR